MITTLVLLGQVLELRARSQTSSAIKTLLGLAPKTARRVSADGHEQDVPLEQVQAEICCAFDRERNFRWTELSLKEAARSMNP